MRSLLLSLILLQGINISAQNEAYNSDSLKSLMDESRFILARSYLQDTKELIPPEKDSIWAEWNIQYAVVNSLIDEHDTAFDAVRNAIQIAKDLNSDYLLFKANTQLIEQYRRNRLYDRALFLIREMRKDTQDKDPRTLARFFHRSAAVYNETPQHRNIDQGYTDTAIALSELSLQISSQYGFENYQATSLNELGNIYERKGYLNQALNYYKMSIDLWIANQDIYLANAVKNLGSYYLRRNEADSALYYFNMVLKILENCDEDFQIYADTYWGIKKAYEAKGDSINYYKSNELESKYVIQLLEEQLERKLMDLSLAYEAKEKDLIIQERNQRLKKEKEQSQYILILLILTSISSIALIYFYFSSKKKNKELQELLQKKGGNNS